MRSNNYYTLLFLSLCWFLFFATNAFTQDESVLVYPGDDGKLVYEKHANTAESNKENIIVDFSNCGYMGGGVEIPNVPVKITVYPMFGDDRQRIQEAINYVSGLEADENGFRGAVLLKAGTYELYDGVGGGDALQIKVSGVVLRGEGQGSNGTILKTSSESKHQMIATRPENRGISTSNKTKIKDPYVGSGRLGFHVEDASGYAVGDIIYVRFTPNQTWLDETYANAYMGDGDLDWDTGTYTISYERTITDITNDSISIHSAIILPMQTKFGGGEIEKITITRERLKNIGVEHMRLIGTGITPTCLTDDPNRLKTAVHFDYTEHSWIRGITVLHTSNSLFKTWNSHYITIEDCSSIAPLGPKRAGYRYTFYFDAASSFNLCQRTFTDDGRHDYVLGPRIPGPNVFLDGRATRGGTEGPHQRWSTGTLFDNLKLSSLIALEHRGTSGSGHSWAGIQSIIWNTESPTIICDAPSGHMNYAIGHIGTEVLSGYINNTKPGVYRGYYDHHGSHVSTRSLYLKQLEDRLGAEAVMNIAIPEQLDGDIYDMLDAWQGKGKLTEYNMTIMNAPTDLAMVDLEYNESSKFIKLQWTDNVPDETMFILERSSDGGESFEMLEELEANIVQYLDTDIQQSTYHYRIKAKNDILESTYCNLFTDLLDKGLYGEISFSVDMQEITDLYEGGDVWLVSNEGAVRQKMTDDNDGIYTLSLSLMVDRIFQYNYAYQNGADSANNIVLERFSGDCINNQGFRHVVVASDGLELSPNLFGTCDVALPEGDDITDLDGTLIFGSNDDEPWIDGDNGAGSPDGERIEKLIDNDINSKYLVRDVYSWVEVKTRNYTKLNGYTITSANDDPTRDPRKWNLKAWNSETESWDIIHPVVDNPIWESRLKTRVWTFDNELWSHRYRMYISGLNGNEQNLMQMAELQLFGEVGDFTFIQENAIFDVQVYPNPVKDYLNIKLKDPVDKNIGLEIYDISGKRVFVSELYADGGSSFQLNITAFSSGFYVLRLVLGETTYTGKILIE
ncbi:MAG: T9SS type A sorting domain-containing protein [Bacteroidales bacterium]|jgi:hypothetical protein|nr:T9SS type A sorting domain-containing protein [Bacteroidales bacterium]